MPRKSMAVLVSLALVLGSISTGASAQTAPTKQDQPAVTATSNDTTKNVSPLPPGGPAGLQQAQGSNSTLWIVGGLIIAGIVLAVVLANQNNNPSTPSTP